LKDFVDVDEILSNKEVLSLIVLLSDLVEGAVDFDKTKSSSSSHI